MFYWEEFGGRQLRLEGSVTRAHEAAADAYFAQRPASSQINAWVSRQSAPLDSLDELRRRAAQKAIELGLDAATLEQDGPAAIARPPHWGGYQLRVEKVEFWTEGAGRFHERQLYERSAADAGHGAQSDSLWRLSRLQP